jgi:SAM-dependent methyltransferase
MGRYSRLLSTQLADLGSVTPGRSVLDVGCGTGALTAELVARLGPGAVAAVDPSPSFVAATRRRHPGVDVRQAPAEELPFPDASFDVALAQLVVHFMTDPVAGLAEMARVTRPDGMVAGLCLGPRRQAGTAPDLLGGGPFARAGDRRRIATGGNQGGSPRRTLRGRRAAPRRIHRSCREPQPSHLRRLVGPIHQRGGTGRPTWPGSTPSPRPNCVKSAGAAPPQNRSRSRRSPGRPADWPDPLPCPGGAKERAPCCGRRPAGWCRSHQRRGR